MDQAELSSRNRQTQISSGTVNSNEDHNDIELVDYLDDELSLTPTVTSTSAPNQRPVRRNPTRDRRLPQRYSEYVEH